MCNRCMHIQLHAHPTPCLASKASLRCIGDDISKGYRSITHWNEQQQTFSNLSALNIVEDLENIPDVKDGICHQNKQKDKEMHH